MLKLGVVGSSEGNGHPYSWSAILNGYNKNNMNECGYPVISDYLSQHSLPEESINGAKVTHVWTQERDISEHIAKSALIENVCESLDEFVSNVDAILLARDDVQSHFDLGLPLLASGKPIYFDKPIAHNLKSLNTLFSAQKYEGQIFSCSALRYSKQLRLTDREKEALGEIVYINCTVPNSWEKYSVHLIDPIVGIFACNEQINSIQHRKFNGINESQVIWETGLITNFSSFSDFPAKIQFDIIGKKSCKSIVWDDAFASFKSTLEVFIHQILTNSPKSENTHHKKVVQIIEEGMK